MTDTAPSSALQACRLIDLPKISDPRGNLTFVEGLKHVPFRIKRVYYVYDVPGGSLRGGHAHKETEEFIVAVAGSFRVTLGDGRSKREFDLDRPYFGLYASPMVWRELQNFSSGSVCLVLASAAYLEADYYRDYTEFLTANEQSRQ